MAIIKIHAGDFLNRDGNYDFGTFRLPTKKHSFRGEKISVKELLSVEIASEENVKKVGGALGWGAAGALALGPAGLLAGLLLGGKKKEVTFIAVFKDGRKMMATTDSKTYTKLQAAVF